MPAPGEEEREYCKLRVSLVTAETISQNKEIKPKTQECPSEVESLSGVHDCLRSVTSIYGKR